MKTKIIFILLLICFLLSSCKWNEPKCDGINHHISDWIITEEATCNSEGSKHKICEICGEELATAIISKTSHTIIADEAVNSTCTTTGLTEGSHCSVCGEVIIAQDVTPKLNHNYILTKVVNPIDTKKGYLEYTCTLCNQTYQTELTEIITCLENHTSSDWIITKIATCTSEGSKHKICEVCGVELEIQVIPQANHIKEIDEKIEPTCTTTGLTEGSHCSICDTVITTQTTIDALGHNYVITSTLNPTNEEVGYIEYTCTKCNDTYKETLAKLIDYDSSLPTTIILADDNSIVTNNNGGVIISSNTININIGGEYDLSGSLSNGNIVINITEEESIILNLQGVNVTSSTANPIYIENGDKIEISSKKDTINYIYDKREITNDTTGGAIYSLIDLEIKGKGELNIYSSYNNGIATTKDLTIKNLTLNITAINNALKGNDSLTIESGVIKAISSSGDALKTENSDISSKGNQRGTITINDGTIDLYAACDAIDASYDVIINGGNINMYTESYSSYSGEVEVTSNTTMYLKFSSKGSFPYNDFQYKILFTNDDELETIVSATRVSSNRSVYYSYQKPSNAKYIKIFAYLGNQTTNYSYCTDLLAINSNYDAYSISSYNRTNKLFYGSWTNYSTEQYGPGGINFDSGNSNSATYSCKGIKADNSITINNGNINIKTHDDAIHANNDTLLETSIYGVGNVTINNGNITIHSDDDAIRADNNITINDGNINITKSYEGLEGHIITINGGEISIISTDDALNASTGYSGNHIYIKGGTIYFNAGGDGIDSNGAVSMTGGVVLALGPTNGGNGVLDFDSSFSFSGGLLLTVGASGMNQRPTASSGSTVKSTSVSLSTSSYITISSNSEIIAVLKITKSNQNYLVFAYNNTTYPSCSYTVSTSSNVNLKNELYYVK